MLFLDAKWQDFDLDRRQRRIPMTKSGKARHVPVSDSVVQISIDDGSLFDGTIPPKQLKMVQAWIEIHKDELLVDWELAVNGDEPFRIAPLQ